jgi:hypothetical protein
MGVIGEWFDDTLTYSKRYDRYDFPGNCLVAIFGGDSPLKRSFGSVSLWLTELPNLMLVVYFHTLMQRHYILTVFLPAPRSCGRLSVANTVNEGM